MLTFNSKDFSHFPFITESDLKIYSCKQIFKTKPPAFIKTFCTGSIVSVPSIFFFYFLSSNSAGLSQRSKNFHAA